MFHVFKNAIKEKNISLIDILKSLLRIGCNLQKGGTKVKKPEKV